MRFQATCSKGGNKLTLSIVASSMDEAKSILHKQGYSIIEIKEIADDAALEQGNFFYFDTIVNGVVQMGKIQSDDIFKAYRKLVEDLKYQIAYIYLAPDATEEEKRLITAKVKDGYRMYIESIGGKIEVKPKKDLSADEQEISEFSPQLLREIEKYNKLFDETIEKIQNLLLKYHASIEPGQKSTLEGIELKLAQLKGTKNINRLQSSLEESLKQIGAIELELLKTGMVQEKAQFLSETNQLLKQIGSKNSVQTEEEKQQTVEYQLGSFFNKVKNFGMHHMQKSEEHETKIDSSSFVYLKNKRELDIYKKSLSKNDQDIVANLLAFRWKQVRRLFLKRKLLTQNIQIIDNRIKNKNISYSKIIHGIGYYNNLLFVFIRGLGHIATLILFFYAATYIVLSTAHVLGFIDFEFIGKSLFFITIFSVFTWIFLLIRGWISLILGITLFLVIFSFLSINF